MITTYTVPQRKNLSIFNVSFANGEARVKFQTATGFEVLELTIDKYTNPDGDSVYRIVNCVTKYAAITKLVAKHEAEKLGEEFDAAFYVIQKRLKSWVRQDDYLGDAPQPEPTPVEEVKPEVKEEVKPEAPKAPEAPQAVKIARPKATGIEAQLQNIVFDTLESEFTTRTLQQKMIELGIEPNRTEIIVNNVKTGEKKNVGTQHELFNDILMSIGAGVNLALVGPAGSGKTTCVKNVAEALTLPFYSKSVSAQTGTHEFFGYQDANGNYVRTLFREAYEKGGVFLVDEFDAGNPNVLSSMNQAVANDCCAFADGMVDKHEDFIVVMAGNTYGHGATSEYIGRNPIDGATLDRFAFEYFGYDEKMELALSTNKAWTKEVQRIRKNVASKKIKAIVSPRASFMGAKLLKAGMDIEKVKRMTIFKGMTQDEINLIK